MRKTQYTDLKAISIQKKISVIDRVSNKTRRIATKAKKSVTFKG